MDLAKTGVLTGDDVRKLFDYAKANKVSGAFVLSRH